MKKGQREINLYNLNKFSKTENIEDLILKKDHLAKNDPFSLCGNYWIRTSDPPD